MEFVRTVRFCFSLILTDREVNALEEIAFANANANVEDFFIESLAPVIANAVTIFELVHKEGDNK